MSKFNAADVQGFVLQGYNFPFVRTVVKQIEAKSGFFRLPADGWWEKFCLNGAWMARFRRLARDHERLATILGPFYFLAFACLIILSHPVCQIESGLIL
jgi:hypothetical protein